jgi:Tol biopolymer transport system component/tRNA A-37 threonylcarbamoyl transferase component Bud32
MAVPPSRLTAALADRYQVERELGQGGMATVYLAEDLKHRRKVALKVLRPELAATLGPERFFREIEVAAKLQHPHILPLHDSGEAQGFLYYVMPFVDGQNLRGRLTRQGELPIHEAVKLLAEVADALAYAHAQGVVHRDIKPDNVLLSGRHALVTDFGVAKAVSEATGRQALTTAGIALGTPAYMAPEQAAADPHIDHRVDIYALGCMGYELLTGRPPFTGQSSQEVLAAHMTQPPELVTSRRPAVPDALAAIVMKCLAKRPADRWQSAEELLQQLEQQLTPSGGMTPTHTRPLPAASTPRSRTSRLAIAAIAALLLLGAGLILARRPAAGTPLLGKRSAVTLDPGLEMTPAISPDGKLVAYSRMTPAESRLVVQQLAGGEPVTVARWPGVYPAMPAWSPDGARLLYTSPRGLEVIPALGGSSRLLASQSPDLRLGWGGWSPDGHSIAYTTADTIYLRDLDAESPRALLRTGGQPNSPEWSPDGKWIAYVLGNQQYPTTGNLAPSSIWVVRTTGGQAVRLTEDRPLHTSPVWLPDSRGLLYVSDEEGGRDVYLRRLSREGVPAGVPTRLTTGLHPHTISLSADGRRLIYSLYTETSNILAVALQSGKSVSLRDAKPVTSGSQAIEGFSISPDGHWLVFDSNRNGGQDIWRMPLDGTSPPEPLSAGPEDEFHPTYSPDGRFVTFHATRSGSIRDLYMIPSGGGQRTRIEVPTPNNLLPEISPDGRSMSYTVWSEGGGVSMRAIRRPAGDAAWNRAEPLFNFSTIFTGGTGWSPDGKWVAFIRGLQVFRAKADGSDPQPIATLPADFTPFYTRWGSDSRQVYYSGITPEGKYLIYVVAISGGPAREVAHSEGPTYQNFRFAFNVRNDTLYFVLADRQSDLWMAEMLHP